jgi:hypothetical protein
MTKHLLRLRTMSQRVRAAVPRTFSVQDPDAQVHFHSGDQGRPYVCERQRCGSPERDIASS